MASYTIHSNVLSGEYTDRYTGEQITFIDRTYHPGLLQYGMSRFQVTFMADNGNAVTHEHEIESVDPIEIDAQLKLTLASYNSSQESFVEPIIETGQPVTL